MNITANPTGRRRAAATVIYGLVFLLVALGILYVLVAASAGRGGVSSDRTPLGGASIAFIQGILQASTASPAFAPVALAAALLLGGLHALTPGHNKTLTGAYLVAAHGRVRHAVLVGTATAFSHTASAIVIGVLALSTTGQIASSQYLRWVSLPSGLLTIGLGLWLLRRHLRSGQGNPGPHDHPHEHDHDHDYRHDRPYAHAASDRVTLGGLVALGLMHGFVPTIDALAIILVALNLGRVGFGIGLVLAYSLGIAGVLIAVGALFIRTQAVLLDHPRLAAFSRRTPALAAAVVIALGAALVFRTLA